MPETGSPVVVEELHPIARAEAEREAAESQSTSSSGGDEGSETPEQRDIRTAREKYGIDISGDEPTAAAPTQTRTTPPEGDDSPLSGNPDEDEEVDEAEEVVEEVEEEAEDESGDELSLDEILDLDDETLTDWLDAVGDDRILQHPRVRERVEELVNTLAEQRFAERQQQVTVTEEQERLIAQGRNAVKGVYDLVTATQAELDKAARGEEFNATLLAKAPELLRDSFGTYGAAIVTEIRRGTETNFAAAFRSAVDVGGPLSKQEAQTVGQIIANARVIENATEPIRGNDGTVIGNGFDAAQRYMQVQTARFTTARAFEAGKQAAMADITRRREAAKRITGDNTVTAAVAKVAKQRQGLPPRTPAAGASSVEATGTMNEYQAAKARGAPASELDAITDRMSRARG